MRQRRLGSRALFAFAAAALCVLLAAVIPSPYAIERPGPVVNALGSIETEAGEEPVVRIDGTQTFETSGAVNVLTVSITGSPDRRNGWLTVLGSLFDRTADRVPLDWIFPGGLSAEQREQQNSVLMRSSQLQAAAAALHELGTPVESWLEVGRVVPDGPSAGVLEKDDRIVSVDGSPIADASALRKAVAATAAGEAVRLGIERAGERLDLEVTPVAPEGGSAPLLGIELATVFDFPYEVDLNLDRIGGPSAGLALALAVYDRLTPGELTGGLRVSATGTIDQEGRVGAIGGLPQKLWGAQSAGTDLMLMPLDNCDALPSRLPSGVVVAPVGDLEEAIAAIETVAAGGTPAGVERCAAR